MDMAKNGVEAAIRRRSRRLVDDTVIRTLRIPARFAAEGVGTAWKLKIKAVLTKQYILT